MFAAIIIRDSSANNSASEILKNYARTVKASKGTEDRTDLQALRLLTTLGGEAPSTSGGTAVLEINQPPSVAGGIGSKTLALRIEPAPDEGPQSELTAEGQSEPVIYAPRTTVFSRRPGSRTISLSMVLDSIFTPRAMGIDLDEWAKATKGKNWISDYISFLHSLTAPLPTIGRKPWLALKYGKDLYGAGRFGLQLEGVTSKPEWQGPSGVQRASIQLRFREYLVV